jgi:predicted HTH transcriptional regulator
LSEGYSITKKERFGFYDIIERVYWNHESRLDNLERMLSSLQRDVDRIKMERYRHSEETYRISDLARKYYMLASEGFRSSMLEEEEVKLKSIPFEKAVTQISRFVKRNPNVTTSDIICKLELEPDLVNRVLFHLEKEGKIRGEKA